MASLACYTCSATRLTVTKPWPNMTAPEPRVKDKHRYSPVALVFCIGRHCDHNLWLNSLFHSRPAALRGHPVLLLSQLSIHLQLHIVLHEDALTYYKRHISSGQSLLSVSQETIAYLGVWQHMGIVQLTVEGCQCLYTVFCCESR